MFPKKRYNTPTCSTHAHEVVAVVCTGLVVARVTMRQEEGDAVQTQLSYYRVEESKGASVGRSRRM